MPTQLSDIEQQIVDAINNPSTTTNTPIYNLYNQYKQGIQSQYGSVFNKIGSINYGNFLYGTPEGNSADLGNGYQLRKGATYMDNGNGYDSVDIIGPDGQVIRNIVKRTSGANFGKEIKSQLSDALGLAGQDGNSNKLSELLTSLRDRGADIGNVSDITSLNAEIKKRAEAIPTQNLGTYVNASGKEVVATSQEMLDNFKAFGFLTKEQADAKKAQESQGSSISMSGSYDPSADPTNQSALMNVYNSRTDLQALYNPDGTAKNPNDPRVRNIPTLQDWASNYGYKENSSLSGYNPSNQSSQGNQPPAGATYISNPADLAGLREDQIWREPGTGRIFRLGSSGFNAYDNGDSGIGANEGQNGYSFTPTGDAQLDSMLQQYQTLLDNMLAQGQQVNPNITFTPEELQRFQDQASEQIDPYYQSQYSAIKEDLRKGLENYKAQYTKQLADAEASFKQNLGNSRENMSGAGLTFSGVRGGTERKTADAQSRQLAYEGGQYEYNVNNQLSQAAQKIGSRNLSDLGLSSWSMPQSASLEGSGGFAGNRSLAFNTPSNVTGSMEWTQRGETAVRRAQLEEEARRRRNLG